jgi:hypothetical protein
MANIPINGGQTYFFSRSQENTFIMDSTDHSHAKKFFGNLVEIFSSDTPQLLISGSTNTELLMKSTSTITGTATIDMNNNSNRIFMGNQAVSTADQYIAFLSKHNAGAGSRTWAIGNDYSDGGIFKICRSAGMTTSTLLTLMESAGYTNGVYFPGGIVANLASTYALTIKHDGNNANRFGMQIWCGVDTQVGNPAEASYITLFDGNGTAVAFVNATGGTVTWGTFTGAHDGHVVNSDDPTAEINTSSGSIYPIGTILVTTKSDFSGYGYQAEHRFISSSAYQDKRVLGVYFNRLNPDALGDAYVYKHKVASLGDGPILVSNQNGNIENGDYITTASGSGGYGCKQDDDLFHNYTVAKSLEDVDWSTEPAATKLISCTYHCG